LTGTDFGDQAWTGSLGRNTTQTGKIGEKMKRRHPNSVLPIVMLVVLLITAPGHLQAQEELQISDQDWDLEFREQLTFTLEATGPEEITQVELLYRIIGQLATSRNTAEFSPGTAITAEFSLDQTDPINYMPPGTELEYWWQVTDAAGNEIRSDKTLIELLDNRYDWSSLESDRVTLYWYQGDDQFGQSLFDRAGLALDTLEQDVGIAVENPIKIFIYGSHNDLLDAISTNAQEWTGGQAFTEHGVVVIGISPRQLDWGLDAMTHEMTHLVIHQATDNPYGDLPRWLDEGIAVYNENQEELDEDFRPVFERAVTENSLMTLRTLSSPFPADPVRANLAYGQSGAVVKFIIDQYGPDTMAQLLAIFADGALYDEALLEVLGMDTDGVDNAFRESLGLPPLPGTDGSAASEAEAEEQSPGAASEEVEPVAGKNDAVVEEAENSEPEQSVIETAIEEPPSASSDVAPEGSSGLTGLLPCLAGIILLLVVGWFGMVGRSG
jgi:hypothetical protein